MKLIEMPGSGKRTDDISLELANGILKLIYQYEGRILLPTAIGVLRIVEEELIRNNLE